MMIKHIEHDCLCTQRQKSIVVVVYGNVVVDMATATCALRLRNEAHRYCNV